MKEKKRMVGIFVEQVIDGVLSNLQAKYRGKVVKLQQPAHAEVADSSDYDRVAKGFMEYESVTVLRIGDSNITWVIAKGKASGTYAVRPLYCILTAIPFDDPSLAKNNALIRQAFMAATYFKNSLGVGLDDGSFQTHRKSQFAVQMTKLMQKQLPDYIAQGVEYDDKVIDWTKPLVSKSMLFKPTFTAFVTEAVQKVLETNS
ncbi:MAG: hypothetical protein UY09_C0011G0002 [Parcubacteria group bacterium GW2011_GWA2_47_8]|nr:MAG: hypothetical protein UY09_C0011G0002 [Parcubacteria group bacterium GW2011_GWA2_47_8]